ncbi:MAG: hypothetical protein ACXWDI_14935 [Nocardioides sp.]
MASHVAASRRHRRAPSRLRLAVVALSAVLLAGTGWWLTARMAPPAPVIRAAPPVPVAVQSAGSVRQASPPAARPVRAVEVLRAWDEARAAAYASGSTAALRELYAGSAGAADARLLRSYLHRGYRVEGMRTQLLDVTVRAHRPGTWQLRVTDRLAGGAAVSRDERIGLPRDRASTRTVRLERGPDGRWRVASVRG